MKTSEEIKYKNELYHPSARCPDWVMEKVVALEQQIERDKNAYGSALQLLIKRSEPFLDPNIVDETMGTIPLIDALTHAIKLANELLDQDK